jgi:hypothetical protein
VVQDLKLVLLGHKNVGMFATPLLPIIAITHHRWSLIVSLIGKTSVFNRYVYDEFGKTSMVDTQITHTIDISLCHHIILTNGWVID